MGGDAVGRLEDGCVIFVPGILPGEKAEVDILSRKKNFARGRLLNILTPSPHRVVPDCQWASQCGGCQFWHTTYPHELDIKSQAALDTLSRISQQPLPTPSLHAASPLTGWRNRATLHAQNHKLGFFAQNSNKLVEWDTCPILHPAINQAAQHLRQHQNHGELLLELQDDQHVVVSTRNGYTSANPEKNISGIKTTQTQHGNTQIPAHVCIAGLPSDLQITLPAGQFRQAHPEMNTRLVELVTQRLAPFSPGRLIELFAGSGNLTWSLRHQWHTIEAFEAVNPPVKAGNQIAKALDAHVRFHKINLFEHTVDIRPDDVVLLDPPRDGAQLACQNMTRQLPRAIAYVSCDPGSLARDLRILGARYTVTHLDFIDMFPRTAHIETFVLLIPKAFP